MGRWKLLASEWLDPVTEEGPFVIRTDPELWRDQGRLERGLQEADGLLIRNQTRVDAQLLRTAERLRVVGRLGSGLDNIDVAAVRGLGVEVVYAPEANVRSVAEFALTQIFSLLRGFPGVAASTSRGEWRRTDFPGREISGCTVGIVGFGRIGRTLAGMLRSLGATVIVHTRRPALLQGEWEHAPLDALLARSDVVAISVAGGPETAGMFQRREFELMKPGARLVNISRGSVIDEEALLESLLSGRLGGVALDVREQEPPVKGRLESLPNVLLTPHVAAFTAEAQERVARTVIADVLAVLEGGEPRWPAP